MTALTVKVLSRREETQDIASFCLGRVDGGVLPPFSPGAHIDVYVPGGWVRPYSLCNGPFELQHYRIAVLRAPDSRGGSVAIHELLREGDLLTIGEPRNNFPMKGGHRSILLAGGIGVTPLLSMAKHMASMDADFSLHYCTRSVAATAFRDELCSSTFTSRVHYHNDDGPAHQRLNLQLALGAPQTGVNVFVCGPEGFIEHVTKQAREAGFGPEQIHVEHFGTFVKNPERQQSFTIQIASTGQRIVVGPHQTAVQALAAAGIEILTSCEQGFCGTCATRVLEGKCDHRDICLSAEEKARHNLFTPCCSRASTPLLVVDL